MIKQITFLRHAKSSWKLEEHVTLLNDHKRPLNNRGEKSSKLIADYLFKQNYSFQLIICSTAKRAIQTASYISEKFNNTEVTFQDSLYTFNSLALMKQVQKTKKTITNLMVVGHNPAIKKLAETIAQPNRNTKNLNQLIKKFPTASFASFNLEIGGWEEFSEQCGILNEFVCPKTLQNID